MRQYPLHLRFMSSKAKLLKYLPYGRAYDYEWNDFIISLTTLTCMELIDKKKHKLTSKEMDSDEKTHQSMKRNYKN